MRAGAKAASVPVDAQKVSGVIKESESSAPSSDETVQSARGCQHQHADTTPTAAPASTAQGDVAQNIASAGTANQIGPVSYTHLTLPTILLV